VQERVCGSCHARLAGSDGLAPVFALYPSGACPSHSKCLIGTLIETPIGL
jgi:hypothetical protein